MTTPLHQVKGGFFQTLSHPSRIRVLELLSEREHPAGELLRAIDTRRLICRDSWLSYVVRAWSRLVRRDRLSTYYSLVSNQIAASTAVARPISTSVLSEHAELPTTLRSDERSVPRGTAHRGGR